MESGWNHNGFRDYWPDLGRYVEPDPLAMLGSGRLYDPKTGLVLSEGPVSFFTGSDFYQYAHNSPPNLTDPTGKAIKVCSRAGWNDWLIGGVANHAYLLDTRNGHNCGRGNQSGKEDPSSSGTSCVEVAGSAGHEDAVMSCCEKTRNGGWFIPGKSDCHSTVANCLKQANLPATPAPGGRWGTRCQNNPDCTPGLWLQNPHLPWWM